MDYADQRYHQPGMGRFLTADPYQSSAGPNEPGSWNRYAYVLGDPIDYYDPDGLAATCPGPTGWTGEGYGPGFNYNCNPYSAENPTTTNPYATVSPSQGGTVATGSQMGSGFLGGGGGGAGTWGAIGGTIGEMICLFLEPCGAFEVVVIGVTVTIGGAVISHPPPSIVTHRPRLGPILVRPNAPAGLPKPNGCPTGTVPIDQYGLSTGQIHDIKDAINAKPRDWVGIAPNGDVIVNDGQGQAEDMGPWRGMTNK